MVDTQTAERYEPDYHPRLPLMLKSQRLSRTAREFSNADQEPMLKRSYKHSDKPVEDEQRLRLMNGLSLIPNWW